MASTAASLQRLALLSSNLSENKSQDKEPRLGCIGVCCLGHASKADAALQGRYAALTASSSTNPFAWAGYLTEPGLVKSKSLPSFGSVHSKHCPHSSNHNHRLAIQTIEPEAVIPNGAAAHHSTAHRMAAIAMPADAHHSPTSGHAIVRSEASGFSTARSSWYTAPKLSTVNVSLPSTVPATFTAATAAAGKWSTAGLQGPIHAVCSSSSTQARHNNCAAAGKLDDHSHGASKAAAAAHSAASVAAVASRLQAALPALSQCATSISRSPSHWQLVTMADTVPQPSQPQIEQLRQAQHAVRCSQLAGAVDHNTSAGGVGDTMTVVVSAAAHAVVLGSQQDSLCLAADRQPDALDAGTAGSPARPVSAVAAAAKAGLGAAAAAVTDYTVPRLEANSDMAAVAAELQRLLGDTELHNNSDSSVWGLSPHTYQHSSLGDPAAETQQAGTFSSGGFAQSKGQPNLNLQQEPGLAASGSVAAGQIASPGRLAVQQLQLPHSVSFCCLPKTPSRMPGTPGDASPKPGGGNGGLTDAASSSSSSSSGSKGAGSSNGERLQFEVTNINVPSGDMCSGIYGMLPAVGSPRGRQGSMLGQQQTQLRPKGNMWGGAVGAVGLGSEGAGSGGGSSSSSGSASCANGSREGFVGGCISAASAGAGAAASGGVVSVVARAASVGADDIGGLLQHVMALEQQEYDGPGIVLSPWKQPVH